MASNQVLWIAIINLVPCSSIRIRLPIETAQRYVKHFVFLNIFCTIHYFGEN